jgi:F-type H+-transporting ATPase subunit b
MIYLLIVALSIFFPGLAHASEAVGSASVESESVLGTLGVNGKLFIAQLVNFTVIFLILWRWVFRPIGKRLDDRSKQIEQSLQDASDIHAQKLEFESWKQKEMQSARIEAANIVTKAKDEAEGLRAEIVAKAKDEEARLRTDGLELLERERTAILDESKKELAGLVVGAVEKVLREKMTDKKDFELASEALKTLDTKH